MFRCSRIARPGTRSRRRVHVNLEIVALTAGIPALALVWRVQEGCANRTPLASVWTSFLVGIVLTLPAVLLGSLISTWISAGLPAEWHAAGRAFLVAALPEEALKLAVLVVYAAAQPRFRGPREGVTHGLAVGLGFAVAENILRAGTGSMETLVLRSASVVPFHALLGVIMGFRVGRAVLRQGRHQRELVRALAVPVALHGLYDACLLFAADRPAVPSGDPSLLAVGLGAGAVATVLSSALVVRRIARRLDREDPIDGVVHPQPGRTLHLSMIVSAWVRVAVGGATAATGAWLLLGTLVFPPYLASGSDKVVLALTLVRTAGGALTLLGMVLASRGLELRRTALAKARRLAVPRKEQRVPGARHRA